MRLNFYDFFQRLLNSIFNPLMLVFRTSKIKKKKEAFMNKQDIIRKLTSRKFWLAIAAFITELIVAFKGDAETAETISGMIMAGATVIAYVLGEGLIDAANVSDSCSI